MPVKMKYTPVNISASVSPKTKEMIEELKPLYRDNVSGIVEAGIRMLHTKEKKKLAEL